MVWTKVGTLGGSGGGGGGGGTPGQRGADGTKVLVGSAAPSLLQGNVGDLYFQTPPPGATGPILIPGPQGTPGPPGPSIPGPQGPYGFNGQATFISPKLSDWTLTNGQAGATLAAANGAVVLNAPASNNDVFSMALKAIPATPYSCVFGLNLLIAGSNYSEAGVLWADTVNSYTKTLKHDSEASVPYLQAGHATDGIYHTAVNYIALTPGRIFSWFRLLNDGANESFSVSADGFNWIPIWTQASNTTMTANKVGFFVNPRNASGVPVVNSLVSYQETHP